MSMPRQQINLYKDELRPVKTLLPARLLVPSLVAFALVLGGLSWWMKSRVAEPRAQAQRIEAQASALEESLDHLSEALRLRVRNNALELEVQQLENQARQLRQVAELAAAPAQATRLPALLDALGRFRPERLWLTEVRIGDGGRAMLLRGHALDAALVPAYVQALSGEPGYAGLTFDQFLVERADNGAGYLSFQVATRCVPGDERALPECVEFSSQARVEP